MYLTSQRKKAEAMVLKLGDEKPPPPVVKRVKQMRKTTKKPKLSSKHKKFNDFKYEDTSLFASMIDDDEELVKLAFPKESVEAIVATIPIGAQEVVIQKELTNLGVAKARKNRLVSKNKTRNRERNAVRVSKSKQTRKVFEEPSAYIIDLSVSKLNPVDTKFKPKKRGGKKVNPLNARRKVAKAKTKASVKHAMLRSESSSLKKLEKKARRDARKSQVKTESGEAADFFAQEFDEKVWSEGRIYSNLHQDFIPITQTPLGREESRRLANRSFLECKIENTHKTLRDIDIKVEAALEHITTFSATMLELMGMRTYSCPEVKEFFTNSFDVISLVVALSGSSTAQKAAVIWLFVRRSGADKAVSALLVTAITAAIVVFEGVHDVVNTESFTEKFEQLSNILGDVWDSDLLKALRNVIILLGTYKFFSKEVGLSIINNLGSIKDMNFESFIKLIGDIFKGVFRFADFFKDGLPFNEIFMSDNPTDSLVKQMRVLLRKKDYLYDATPVEGLYNYRDWALEATTVLRIAKAMLAKMPAKDKRRAALEAVYETLAKDYAERVQKSIAQSRKCPYAIVIHGEPGIGKSNLIIYCAYIYNKTTGRDDFTPLMIHHRVENSDFWDGYDPMATPYVHYSEPGNKKKGLVSSAGDPVIAEFCSVIDRLPKCLNFSKVEDKGSIYCNPELVLIDTNSPDMNLDDLVKNPAAIRRRFLYIEPIVKDEFRKENSPAIDPTKSMKGDGPLLNRYTFHVRRFIPKNIRDSIEVVTVLDNIYELTKFLEDDIKRHVDVENMTSNPVEMCKNAYDVYQTMGQPVETEEKGYEPDRSADIVVESGIETVKNFSIKMLWNMTNPANYADEFAQFRTRVPAIAEILFKMFCFYSLILMSKTKYPGYIACVMMAYLALCMGSFSFQGALLCAFCYMLSLDHVFSPANLLWEKIRLLTIRLELETEFIRHLFTVNSNYDPLVSRFEELNYSKPLLKGLAVLVTLVTTGVLAKKFFNHKTRKSQKVESAFVDRSDESVRIEDHEKTLHCGSSYSRVPNSLDYNVWNVKHDMPDISYTGSSDNLYKLISPNIKFVTLPASSTTRRFTTIFGVSSHYALINTHFLGDDWQGKTLTMYQHDVRADKDSPSGVDTQLSISEVRILSNDISLIRLSGYRFKNVLKHINDLVNDLPSYLPATFCTQEIMCYYQGKTSAEDPNLGTVHVERSYSYDYPQHAEGLCGSPVVGKFSRGSMIMAIHFGGAQSSSTCFGVALSRNEIMSAIEDFEANSILLSPFSVSHITTQALEMPSRKSAWRYEYLPGLEYYGKLPGNIMMNNKSQLVKTVYHDAIPALLEKHTGYISNVKYGPPRMKPITTEGVYYSPYNVSLAAASHRSVSLDKTVLKVVFDVALKHILDGLGDIPELSPLDVDTAINGISTDCFLRRINMSTGAGFGFTGKKSSYFPIMGADEDEFVYREPNADMRERILHLLDSYSKEEGTCYFFSAHLKDEARPVGKKTRVFYICPTDYLVVARMALFPFYSLMVQYSSVFYTAVGINPHKDSDTLANTLREFATKYSAGDFKYWDVTQVPDIRLVANRIVYEVLKHAGYNADALKLVKGVLGDSTYPIVEMLKDVFTSAGLLPSGMYATAEHNSLLNLLIGMYIFYSKPKIAHLNYFEHVMPITYGDDRAEAIKDSVIEYYNGTVMQESLLRDFNMTYTAPDKSPVVPKYISFGEIDFLKRKFVWRKDLNKWVMPLALESIYKSLSWTIPSRNISAIEQTLSSCNSTLREMFFHLDQTAYVTFREEVIMLIQEGWPLLDLAVIAGTFPTFGEINDMLYELEYDGEILLEEKDAPALFVESGMHVYATGQNAHVKYKNLTTLPVEFDLERGPTTEILQLADNKNNSLDEFERESHTLTGETGSLAPFYAAYHTAILAEKRRRGISMKLITLRNKVLWNSDSRERAVIKKYLHLLELENDVETMIDLITKFKLKKLSTDFMMTQSGEELYIEIDKATDEKYSEMGKMLSKLRQIQKSKSRCNLPVVLNLHESKQLKSYKVLHVLETALLNRIECESSIKTESGVEGQLEDGLIDSSVVIETENFTDVGGSDSKETDAGTTSYKDSFIRPPSVENFFERPVEIVTTTLAVGAALSSQLDLWDLLSLQPSIRAKFRNFAFFRGDIKVRVNVSGTPFHYGRLLMAYVPYPDRNDALITLIARFAAQASARPLVLSYLLQTYGCQLININENQPAEMTIPFISHKPAFRLMNSATAALGAGTSLTDFAEAGSFFLYTLNSPKATTATPSDISIQVVANFTNVELFSATASQMVITTESGDERDVGPVEYMSSKAALYSSWFKKVPVIGQFAQASSMMFTGLSEVAAVFGWSRPTIIEDIVVVKNQGYSNGAITIGGETNYRIVLDPKQELCIDPTLFGRTDDEMSINHITSINSWIDTIAWLDDSPIMATPIFKVAVLPSLGIEHTGLTNSVLHPSAMCFAAAPFYFWRGDIIFEFDIVVSKYHRGKLLFYYEPNVSQRAIIDADLSTNKQFLAIIDIQETQNVKFCISWANSHDWLKIPTPNGIGLQASYRASPNQYAEFANGYIGVVPFTALQSPDDSDIDINVFVKSENMKYNYLNSSGLPTNRTITTESGVESSVPVSCIELNGKSTDASYIADQYFGEVPLSFRSLLKRYTYSTEQAFALTASAGYLTSTLLTYPVPRYPLTSAAITAQGISLWDYLRYAYLGVRGGMKKRLFYDATGVDRHSDSVKISLNAPSAAAITGTTFSATRGVNNALVNGTISCMMSSNAGLEYELPLYTNNLYLYACADDYVGTNSGNNNFQTVRSLSYRAAVRLSATTTAGIIIEESAIGEDLSFYRFISSVPIVLS